MEQKLKNKLPDFNINNSSCRNIDEMYESELNSTVEDFETYVPKGIEHVLALIVLLKQLFGRDAQLEGWTSDCKGACRQVRIGPQHHK